MTWKQPIPTGLEKIFGEDYRVMQLYKELIYRANNTTQPVSINGTTITLQRGQVIFGRHQYARYLGWSPATVETVKQRFFKKYNVCNIISSTNKYSIFSLNNYDDLVGYNINDNNRTSSGHHQNNTSKNDKNEKNNITTSGELSDNNRENLQLIDAITQEDISEIAQLRSISDKNVQVVLQELRNYALDKKFTYVIKDARRKLEEWVDRQMSTGTIKAPQTLEEIIREQTGDPTLKIS